jgi:nitrite reductase/ring-hydroxylating ferredoxin subunit
VSFLIGTKLLCIEVNDSKARVFCYAIVCKHFYHHYLTSIFLQAYEYVLVICPIHLLKNKNKNNNKKNRCLGGEE